MKLKFVKDHKDAKIPFYATEGAAGFDLTSVENTWIKTGERLVVSTGLRAEIPAGKEIQIRPRSGFAANNGVTVLNTPGTIDSDYKGIIKVILINHGTESVIISVGDRIAQGVFANVEQAEIIEGKPEDLSSTLRGEGGFGSTGK
jgi:dUTP pyrophosphatase